MECESADIVGVVRQIVRYPVKSMAGEEITASRVGWHGLLGDRHYAFVCTGNTTHFPWLTARQVPALLRHVPSYEDPSDPITSPLMVRTPDGHVLSVDDVTLRDSLTAAHHAPVHLMRLDRGAFDSMPLSVTSTASLAHPACAAASLSIIAASARTCSWRPIMGAPMPRTIGWAVCWSWVRGRIKYACASPGASRVA